MIVNLEDDTTYQLKRKYDLFCHEFCEAMNAHMRAGFYRLGGTGKPVLLGLLAEALHDFPLADYTTFTRRLRELWGEAGGEEEPLTEREIREIRGDERCHAIMDGERV